jgi:hypothetical protein
VLSAVFESFSSIFSFLTLDILLLMRPVLDLIFFMGSVNIQGLCDADFFFMGSVNVHGLFNADFLFL